MPATRLETYFDARLCPSELPDADLELLCRFGLESAVVAPDPSTAATTSAVLAHLEDLVERQVERLRRLGLRAWAMVGVPPQCLPARGQSALLEALPGLCRRGRVVAIGGMGFFRGGTQEKDALVSQLELAMRLNLPCVVPTPTRDKERLTRALLSFLRTQGVEPARVLLDRTTGNTLRLTLEFGHWAGLSVHPDALSAERAEALIGRHGTERLVLSSGLGGGGGDLLGLSRLLARLRRGGLSARVIRRCARENASRFYRLDDRG